MKLVVEAESGGVRQGPQNGGSAGQAITMVILKGKAGRLVLLRGGVSGEGAGEKKQNPLAMVKWGVRTLP